MRDSDRNVEHAIRVLQEPVTIGDEFDRRVMAEVARGPAPALPGPAARAARWLVRPRSVRVSPLTALAVAAALAIVVLRPWEPAAIPSAAGPSSVAQERATGSVPTRFMLVAPNASAVSLVGDFNDWATDSTPMASTVSGGLWTVTVPLSPGRYRYAFLVDGRTWVPDPGAPRAIDDDFGRPNSVLTIGGT